MALEEDYTGTELKVCSMKFKKFCSVSMLAKGELFDETDLSESIIDPHRVFLPKELI